MLTLFGEKRRDGGPGGTAANDEHVALLKQGADAWNAWREKSPDIEPDLRREFQIAATEGEGKPLNELLLRPALNVRGIESGRVGRQAPARRDRAERAGAGRSGGRLRR